MNFKLKKDENRVFEAKKDENLLGNVENDENCIKNDDDVWVYDEDCNKFKKEMVGTGVIPGKKIGKMKIGLQFFSVHSETGI